MKLFETELRLVKKGTEFEAPDKVMDPKDAAKLFEEVYDMSHQAQEVFVVLLLDELNHIMGVEKVALGDVNYVDVSLHELFKRCFLHDACKMIVCHNHIRDDAKPSLEDLKQTWEFIQAGIPLGIKLEDHVVIADGKFFSIRIAFLYEKYSPEDDFSGKELEKVYQKIKEEKALEPLPIN